MTSVNVPASWAPGSSAMKFITAETPLRIPIKSHNDNNLNGVPNGVPNGAPTSPGGAKPTEKSFLEICMENTPPCTLNPFLFNGHLQTAWTAAKFDGPHIHYKRRTFASDEATFDGHFTIDMVVAPPPPSAVRGARDGGPDDVGLREDPTGIGHYELPPRTTYFSDAEFDALPSNDTKPLLITLHGLSGGSFEVYLRHVLAPLVAATPDGGAAGVSGGEWEAIVVNSRGCAGSRLTSSILYNARATWDVRQVVKWARAQWPNRPIFGIGYSLGGNILTNYVAEESTRCILSAAVVISNPWNLEVSAIGLHRSWIGLEVYSATMGKNMRHLFDLHEDVICQREGFYPDKIRAGRYLYEFDRDVQCPAWGYATESEYYRDASSSDAVLAIRIPFFAVHAHDDPIVASDAVPYAEIQQNPYVVMCITARGGHLSWFELGGQRWHAKPTVNFLRAMVREVDPSQVPRLGIVRHNHKGAPFKIDVRRRKAHVPGTPY